MRILAGADFHGTLEIYRWFLSKAHTLEAEALVLAGDLLAYADEVADPLEDQRLNAVQIQRLFQDVEIPILYVMGNDDLFELERSTPASQCIGPM